MNRLIIPVGLLLFAGGGCQNKAVDPTPSCQVIATIDTETWTYQFDPAGRVTHIAQHTTSNDVDYAYAYQGKQATVDITYPRSGTGGLHFHYDLTLNDQGYVLAAKETMYTPLANGTTEARLIHSHTCTYDGQGYLTTHHDDRYTYPVGGNQQLTETTDAQLSYQDGNPVMITYLDKENNQTKSASTTTNQYGTQLNPLKMSFLLEANPFDYSPDRALQPLLGKPPRTLPTRSVLIGTISMTTLYTYRTNASGQLTQVGRVGDSAPFTISVDNTCP